MIRMLIRIDTNINEIVKKAKIFEVITINNKGNMKDIPNCLASFAVFAFIEIIIIAIIDSIIRIGIRINKNMMKLKLG